MELFWALFYCSWIATVELIYISQTVSFSSEYIIFKKLNMEEKAQGVIV